MPDDAVVTYQGQVELGGLRVETLKSVSPITADQEYIDVVSKTPDGKALWDYVHGLPGWKNVTLTRGSDKSEAFTQWIQEARDPASNGAEQHLILVLVNAVAASVPTDSVLGRLRGSPGLSAEPMCVASICCGPASAGCRPSMFTIKVLSRMWRRPPGAG
ncbi:hypothetical protein AB0M57_29785 [Streptomyces sp. NPDC051597]|uniref:hypothetical protein n=1 Tax=Streptomyces sp. NPDC051597 TaxID=3155049 RepID=UPI00341BE238